MRITRRHFVASTSVSIVTSALGARLRAQPPAAQPPTATAFEAIRGNVGFFTGRGGTIGWLVSPDGVVVVDSQFPDTAQACLDGVKQKSSRGIDALINTHHHGDHTGGNGVFRPAAKLIVGHARVPELQKQAAAQQQGGGQAAPTVPDTTFDMEWTLRLGAETVRARHYGPAHTGGDAVVTFTQANVAHMGDLMFHRRHPFIDRPAGASIANWITVLDRTVKDHAADTVYIFGHAKQGLPVTGSAADLKAFRDYLTAVLEFTRKGIAAGQSREAVTAAKELPGFADYQEAPPRLTLAMVLGVAFDELQNR